MAAFFLHFLHLCFLAKLTGHSIFAGIQNNVLMTFTLSTEAINSYRFITKTAGIDLTEFKRNPVMLFDHNTGIVLGKWENIRKEGGKLLADAVFDEKDPFALQVKSKIEQGFLKATSIGFNIDWDSATLSEGITTVNKSALLEASIVAIPANKEAQLVHLSQEQNKQLRQLSNKQNKLSMKLITQYLGLKEGAGEGDLLASMQGKDAEIQKLQAELAALKKEALARAEAAKAAQLSAAVRDGKITAKEAEVFKALSEGDIATLLSERKVPAPTPAPISSLLLNAFNCTEEPKAMSFSELSKNDPKKLAKIKAENPALYEELYNKEFETK